jgi:putative NADPH-quinone reductase
MKVFVIIGHQHKGSFCHAIVETAVEELKAAGHEVIYHDLYEEGFDPILPHGEILKDASVDDVVRKHGEEVATADGYVVVHPNWWSQPPAILKGWMDRVLRQGIAYEFAPDGSVNGFFKGRTAVVLTTSNTPRDVELQLFGDPLENLWKRCVFGFCGLTDFHRRNFESVILSSQEQRVGWLEEVRKTVRDRFPSATKA